ncbi:MAG: hypothetical protein M1482_12570 [Chloroflexi bacterium]|nr:hypothetical protein [Chloroflexota bacterium]
MFKFTKAFLLAVFLLAGVATSAAPILAASAHPTHPTAGYILDDQPTPTPTPILVHPDSPCTAGC